MELKICDETMLAYPGGPVSSRARRKSRIFLAAVAWSSGLAVCSALSGVAEKGQERCSGVRRA